MQIRTSATVVSVHLRQSAVKLLDECEGATGRDLRRQECDERTVIPYVAFSREAVNSSPELKPQVFPATGGRPQGRPFPSAHQASRGREPVCWICKALTVRAQ